MKSNTTTKTLSRNLRGNALIDYKQTLNLTLEQKQVLIGVLLGDASALKPKGKINVHIQFEQTSKQQTYIDHLYELFKPFVGTGPRLRHIKGGGANPRTSFWFRTYNHNVFEFYYNAFYKHCDKTKKTKKMVPKTIHKLLTCRGLAYWFMDDGSNRKNLHYYFNTQSFSYNDVKVLGYALKYNFDLDTAIYKDRSYSLLYIKKSSNNRFANIIKPYVLPSFYYKILCTNV